MDIENYLSKKKDLERKKEVLEAKEKLKEEKEKIRKKPVKIHKEPPHDPHPRPHRDYHDHHDRRPHHPGGGTQWFFLGIAFFVALIIVGIFSLYYFFPKEETSTDIEELESLIKGLKENPSTSEETEEEIEETEDNETEEPAIGPEFNIVIADGKKDDEESAGPFDEDGKINGKILVIGTKSAYWYRLIIQNVEDVPILCKVDEEIQIDEDSDGIIEEIKPKLDIHILEIDKFEEESIPDSIMASGSVTGIYETRCYYCEDSDCDTYYEEGVTKKIAKFRVLINPTSFGNNTNSS